MNLDGLVALAAISRRAFPRGGVDGLGVLQLQLLVALGRRDNQTVGDLAADLGIHQSTASQALAGLVEDGLTTYKQTQIDLRLRMASLTPKGRGALSSYVNALDPSIAQLVLVAEEFDGRPSTS